MEVSCLLSRLPTPEVLRLTRTRLVRGRARRGTTVAGARRSRPGLGSSLARWTRCVRTWCSSVVRACRRRRSPDRPASRSRPSAGFCSARSSAFTARSRRPCWRWSRNRSRRIARRCWARVAGCVVCTQRAGAWPRWPDAAGSRARPWLTGCTSVPARYRPLTPRRSSTFTTSCTPSTDRPVPPGRLAPPMAGTASTGSTNTSTIPRRCPWKRPRSSTRSR